MLYFKKKEVDNMKKSYNPFKMWGSYVGALLPLIYTLFVTYAFITCEWECGMIVIGIYTGVIATIIGFLIGYGIHALIRALRN